MVCLRARVDGSVVWQRVRLPIVEVEAAVILFEEQHEDDREDARAHEHPVHPQMAYAGNIRHDQEDEAADVHAFVGGGRTNVKCCIDVTL